MFKCDLMPFCSDVFSACFILHRAVRAVLSVTELYVNIRAAFRYYKRSQQFRLLAILLNEFNIALKVLSVGLKPVLHEYHALFFELKRDFIIPFLSQRTLPFEWYFTLLSFSGFFFSHAEGLFEMGYNLCISFINAGFRPAR